MPDHAPQPAAARSDRRPILVFDVNETLLDFTALAPLFDRIFGDEAVVREWFNQSVVYSEALSLAGDYADAAKIGVAVLTMLADAKGRTVDPAELTALKQASASLPTYPETAGALASLRQAGFRMVTLSNNPTAAHDVQLGNAGLRPFFERLFSIDDTVHRYKPATESYISVARAMGVEPSDLWLVSCHAFDTLGAAAAGLRTALVLRPENAPIALGHPPDIVGKNLQIVADALIARHRA